MMKEAKILHFKGKAELRNKMVNVLGVSPCNDQVININQGDSEGAMRVAQKQ